DFLSRMIRGCIQARSAPELSLKLNMTPVDFVGKAIIYLSGEQNSGKAYHLINPNPPVHWNMIIRKLTSLGYRIKMTSYDLWRSLITEESKHSSDNPLIAILPLLPEDESLLESNRVIDCQNTLDGLAGTPITCPIVNEELLQTYFSSFISRGTLPAPDRV